MILPNILLIVLDAVRWDHLSCYGYHRPTSPNIDKICNQGVLFENAFSSSCWTPPSHASLFTGLYPSFHGVLSKTSCLDLPTPMLAEILKETGYRTMGISCIPQLSISKQFNRGFECYVEAWKLDGQPYKSLDIKSKLRSLIGLDDTLTKYACCQIKEWINHSRKSSPFFIFANLNAAHTPYTPPTQFRRKFALSLEKKFDRKKLKRLATRDGYLYMAGRVKVTPEEFQILQSWYDAEIAYLDHTIGEIFEILDNQNLLNNTFIILLADHGENFGHHGLMYHQFCLYDSLIQIPMVWHYPNRIIGGRRIANLISITDVMPSIIRYTAASLWNPTENQLPAKDFFENQNQQNVVIAEYDAAGLKHFQKMAPEFDYSIFDKSLKCVRTRQYKYIIDSRGMKELYDVIKDPGEKENLTVRVPRVAKELHEILFGMVRDFGKERLAKVIDREDEITEEKLKALGYF